jgi:hypothetical protein
LWASTTGDTLPVVPHRSWHTWAFSHATAHRRAAGFPLPQVAWGICTPPARAVLMAHTPQVMLAHCLRFSSVSAQTQQTM